MLQSKEIVKILADLKQARQMEEEVCPYCLVNRGDVVKLEESEDVDKEEIKDQLPGIPFLKGKADEIVDWLVDELLGNSLKCPKCGQRALFYKT